MTPKVSVIVPCYKVELYLDRCVSTLVSQTLREIEIILVDDGSPDNVPQICEAWAKRDSRIRVVHKENAGLGFARNTGLDCANGEYIAFIDSDDYIDVNAYEDAYKEAVLNNSEAVLWGINKEVARNVWQKNASDCKRILEGRNVVDFLLDIVAAPPYEKKERFEDMSVWHGIYKKTIIDTFQIRFLSERDVVCEDIPFDVEFLTKTKKVVVLDKPYSYYCLNENSLSSTFKEDKFEKFIKLYKLLNEKLDLVENAKLRNDRFFIGFIRSYILNLCKTTKKNKLEIIKRVACDPVWEDVKKGYKPSYLPLHQRIHLWLLYKKYIKLLCAYSHFVLLLKKKR